MKYKEIVIKKLGQLKTSINYLNNLHNRNGSISEYDEVKKTIDEKLNDIENIINEE